MGQGERAEKEFSRDTGLGKVQRDSQGALGHKAAPDGSHLEARDWLFVPFISQSLAGAPANLGLFNSQPGGALQGV